MKKTLIAAALVAGLGLSSVVAAQDATPWVLRFGVHNVDPKSNSGTLAGGALSAKVGSDAKPTISIEYMFNKNVGLWVQGALPFEHEIKLNGVKAATVKQLPPTVSVNYHFMPDSSVSPFVGVGVNMTTFFSTHTYGPLAGTSLKVDDSFGLAAHAGVDFRINPSWLVTADLYWINIEPDVKVNGSKVGSVKIDPLVYGLSVGYRF